MQYGYLNASKDWKALILIVFCFIILHIQVCQTYASQVVVPKSIDDETLVKAASFRQLNRFPVLSYVHKQTGVSFQPSIDIMLLLLLILRMVCQLHSCAPFFMIHNYTRNSCVRIGDIWQFNCQCMEQMLDNLEFTNLQYIHNMIPTVSIFINLHCLVIK